MNFPVCQGTGTPPDRRQLGCFGRTIRRAWAGGAIATAAMNRLAAVSSRRPSAVLAGASTRGTFAARWGDPRAPPGTGHARPLVVVSVARVGHASGALTRDGTRRKRPAGRQGNHVGRGAISWAGGVGQSGDTRPCHSHPETWPPVMAVRARRRQPTGWTGSLTIDHAGHHSPHSPCRPVSRVPPCTPQRSHGGPGRDRGDTDAAPARRSPSPVPPRPAPGAADKWSRTISTSRMPARAARSGRG